MAVGKNKRLSKGGKRASKRKAQDAMLNKEWYDLCAPANFQVRHCGKTIANKSKGTFSGPDSIKGRVFEVNLADLMSEDKDYRNRKVQLRAEDVQGRNVILNFHGMSLTTDKLRSMLRKWCTLVEGSVETKTSDGYTMRLFAIGFTEKRKAQVRKNCHCQTSHVKKIRDKMTEIIVEEVSKNPLDKVLDNLKEDVMGQRIARETRGIFPLRDVCIRKVKVTKVPKVDVARVIEQMHKGDVPASYEGGRSRVEESAPAPAQEEAAAEEAED